MYRKPIILGIVFLFILTSIIPMATSNELFNVDNIYIEDTEILIFQI